MVIDLKGKQAIVSGSTQGIGFSIAMELATAGASVVLISRDKPALRKAMEKLPNSGQQQHELIVADFARPNELSAALQTAIVKSGKTNILVNNTGGPPPGPLIEADAEALRIAFNMHVICNHILTQAVVEGMKKSGYGRIINIISTSVKQPIPGLGVSNTIRAAVANWAKTLSLELGPFGITVNNVLPGGTSTERLNSLFAKEADRHGVSQDAIRKEWLSKIPAGRFADASEIAKAVAFLASPHAAYINGINLPVDGGRTGSL